jgi:poly-gamma-glutamate synthesis protein (capsule biosynthesis protein)
MRNVLKTLLVICSLLLICEIGFLGFMMHREKNPDTPAPGITGPQAAVPEATAAPETTVPETTVAPTTEPREPEYFTLTFTGDVTPGCMPGQFQNPKAYVGTVGDDYEFPFANLRETFEQDDFTFINLEVVLGLNVGKQASKTFVFSGPEEYVQIMTSSSVEAVTLANNHVEDFGIEGYENTKRVLDENGVAYVEEDKTAIFVTESGLTIGLYADSFDFVESDIVANITALQEQGAEVIVCAFHWGTEGAYRHNDKQARYARCAIDAGADIVVGNHPHVLQEMEEYNGGIIFYSLGNFSFGGNDHPKDYDSAVIQQQIVREPDGTVRLGEMTVIPICISSVSDRNNYQPIPYPAASDAYKRVLEKLNGTYSGPNVTPGYDYSKE